MTTHKQTALDCAVRIANTRLMKSEGDIENITEKILKTAQVFEEYLGPDPVKSYGGQKQEKPTFDKPCPVCKGDMFDLRASKKNPAAPDARCKDTKWNPSENKYEGCSGLYWPPREGDAE